MRTVRKTLHRPENLALIQLLRELRMQSGLRQAELGERLSVAQNFVSNVEQGIRRLDIVELRDYAAALGLPFLEIASMWEGKLPSERRSGTTKRPAAKRTR